MGRRRPAVTKAVAMIVGAVVLVALISADFYLTTKSNSNGPTGIDIRIIEDDPVHQIDHFYPDNVSAVLGENISLAVQNGDDEVRVFTIAEFGINLTMSPGTTARLNFQADKVGNFLFFSPVTPPSAVSQGRPGPYLSGNFAVTQ